MKLLIFFLFSFLLSAVALAGGVSGGGSDHLPDDYGAAWFLEGVPARTFKVCFMQDPQKFPMDQILVINTFKSAMDSWTAYISDKKVNDDEMEEGDEVDPLYMRIVTSYEILAHCGQEDLTVYLGYSNKEVEEIRAKLFDPYAMAHKLSFDKEKGWGKGFIWLRGIEKDEFLWDKNALLNLRGVLTHELGHVFGNDHRDGTIMAGSFSEQLILWEIPNDGMTWDFYKFFMSNIDWSEELVQCLTCKFVHDGGILWLPGSRAEKETFRFLTGASLKGTVVSRVNVIRFEKELFEGTYTVTDGHKTVTYPIFFPTNSLNFTAGEGSVFKRTLSRSSQDGEWSLENVILRSSDFAIINLTGWMEKDGKFIPLIFEGKSSPVELMSKYPEDEIRNAYVEKTYPYRLIALDGKERHILFAKFKVTKYEGDDGEEGRKLKQELLKNLK
ncbi:MAG: hypothetical protein H0V66_07960 [Bdellovibrionales bacterium]|nr:hypothetical protein [Bdellovibrionales bacterium]